MNFVPQAKQYIQHHLLPLIIAAQHTAEAVEIALNTNMLFSSITWKYLHRLLQTQLRTCREYLLVLQEIETKWLNGHAPFSDLLQQSIQFWEQQINSIYRYPPPTKEAILQLNRQIINDLQQIHSVA